MPIKTMINTLEAFKRYVDYMNDNGQDDIVESVKENGNSLLITMRGHMGETHELEVYICGATGELCIFVNDCDIFDLIDFEDYELTKEKLHYIKFGN